MSIFKHKDGKNTSIGCFGLLIIVFGGVLVISAFLKGDDILKIHWLTAIAGIAIFGIYMGMQTRSAKRIEAYQKKRNERATNIRNEVLTDRNPSTPYFVYLRPFDIDGKFVFASRTDAEKEYIEEYGLPTAYHDLESFIALLVHPFGELVALSDKEGRAGAGYVKSTDNTWKNDVTKMCKHAEGIFIVPFDFDGTAWEVKMLKESGFMEKTFFIMPSQPLFKRWFGINLKSRDYEELWETGQSRYSELRLKLPDYDPYGGIINYSDQQLLAVFGGKFNRERVDKKDIELLRTRLKALAAKNTAS